jgi:hypothetical protein
MPAKAPSTRHRWGEAERLPHKTERQCPRCEMVKVTRHEFEAGREIYWTEFWRDEEQIVMAATPPCDARLEAVEKTGEQWTRSEQTTSP